VKKTYFFLCWNDHVRKWCTINQQINNLTLHRSLLSREGRVTINIAKLAHRSSELINVKSEGFYLKFGNSIVPILKAETSGAIKAKYIGTEHTIQDTPLTQTNVVLWSTVVPAPPSAPAPSASLKPIPQRIAWLIAEDSCKKGELCSIITSEITPITAGVTSCFHVFDYESISTWLNTKDSCPVCREKCVVTKAFDS
jgi:hypothetical protein